MLFKDKRQLSEKSTAPKRKLPNVVVVLLQFLAITVLFIGVFIAALGGGIMSTDDGSAGFWFLCAGLGIIISSAFLFGFIAIVRAAYKYLHDD